MNKKEIDAWLKDLDERHEKQLWKEGIKWKEEDKDSRYYGEIRSDLDTEYHYVVVIPEDVYELLPPDEQEKFDGCDLTDWMDEAFVVEEHGVEADELNELWQICSSDSCASFLDLNFLILLHLNTAFPIRFTSYCRSH